MPENYPAYQSALWEKITAAAVAVFIVAFISFLIISGIPSEQNAIAFARILISLASAILGAVIPGFLGVNLQAKRQSIRAGGALALFVITYFFTPNVIPPPPPPPVKVILEGTVLDVQQNPVVGAEITFLGGFGAGTNTGTDGSFVQELSFPKSGGIISLNVYHKEYYSNKKSVKITQKDIKDGRGKKINNIILKRRDR